MRIMTTGWYCLWQQKGLQELKVLEKLVVVIESVPVGLINLHQQTSKLEHVAFET
jgi:hypothetical protein